MKIEVRPIERKTWHGKTGKDSFTRPKTLQALVNAETLEYATGLNTKEEEEYGKIFKQDLSKMYSHETPHLFWDSKTARIKLENHTLFFDTDRPLDFIKYKIMKESKYIANSMLEYEDGAYPEATHVLFDEAAANEVKASKIQIKKKAIIESNKLAKTRKVQLLMILAGKNAKNESDDFIEVEIDKLVEKDPSKVVDFIMKDKEKAAMEALVLECLQKNVLKKVGHKILYHDSILGVDMYDVAEYLNDVKNQELKLRLLAQIN
tara:strand:- start:4323 stop:5111 length:789 start_codon:yes stop_codon:yes gene_type:complete